MKGSFEGGTASIFLRAASKQPLNWPYQKTALIRGHLRGHKLPPTKMPPLKLPPYKTFVRFTGPSIFQNKQLKVWITQPRSAVVILFCTKHFKVISTKQSNFLVLGSKYQQTQFKAPSDYQQGRTLTKMHLGHNTKFSPPATEGQNGMFYAST